jgi:cell surface protein SprA
VRNNTRSVIIAAIVISSAMIMFSSARFPDEYSAKEPGFNFGVKDSIDGDTDLVFSFPDYRNRPGMYRYQSPLYFKQPSNIQSSVEYDPKTGKFKFIDKIGDLNYRTPYYMDFDEYMRYSEERARQNYWKERFSLETASGSSQGIDRLIDQNLVVPIKGFDKVFGSNTINVTPQGNAELIFGVNISNVENRTLPEDLQKTVTFDFDEKINMGVNGQIGDKLNIGINFDTEATFEFENNVKLAFKGDEDEIIQNIEAGNVSMPLSGSLIAGSHSLFGLKTTLQFGKLTMTSVVSQQKGEIKTIEVEGGAMTTPFEITADDYESGKHFFLSQYFKNHYDEALRSLPLIRSGVNITKIEVWVTNRSGQFDESRNIVAFTDLGEESQYLYSPNFSGSQGYPANSRNTLYNLMNTTYSGIRNISNVSSVLSQISQFEQGADYEKVQNARKLEPSEYFFHPSLGYISLNSALRNDEVLAVAYEYTVGGQSYRVGEFSDENPPAPQTLFLKLLKTTTLSTDLPTWELMMKNVYSVDAFQVSPDDFVMEVMYRDDKTGTSLNYIPAGKIDGNPLLRVMELDNINKSGDPQSDGVFDFIDKVTINSNNGRIYFPVVEPFGEHLRKKITGGDDNDPELNRIAEQYVFDELYTKTQSQARQTAEKNKFFLQGSYRSAGGSEINLQAMNVPQGSVTVTAGGRKLTENVDYTVDYNLGRVSILNQGLLESGTPIKISLESNSMFNVGTKTFLGTRLDYRLNEDVNIGGTLLHLNRKPLTTKINIGNEPISNTIWGTDFSVSKEVPFLTKLTDMIPFIDTKERSVLDVSGEFAQLIPGYPKSIGEEGYAHIDDFEAAETSLDLKTPNNWKLASVPQGQSDMFPEADSINALTYGYNRAKFAWYIVNTDFLRNTSTTPDHITVDEQSDHRVREVYERELFPNRDPIHGVPPVLSVLNLAYYPQERGPYNFDTSGFEGISAGINQDGSLRQPQTRWGGIMRSLVTNDFEEANIEYIEMWLMDPFHYDDNESGGELYLNLGNISEDILRDGRQSFENGLPTGSEAENVDTTTWGRVPVLPRITEGFANQPADARQYQDVGLDGLGGDDERSFFTDYLESLRNLHGAQSQAYLNALNDPANDDYRFYKSDVYDQEQAGILERYKRFNNMEGNSGTAQDGDNGMTAGEQLPDMEDINRDYTLSESETYFQYKLELEPSKMTIGENFITDIKESTVKLKNEQEETIKWYRLKIPIREFSDKVGAIQDFKSIRFMRLFMRQWEEPIVLRFAEMSLVRSEWRKYDASLLAGTEGTGTPEITEAGFEIASVNIEENAFRSPVNYVLPPGITREISPDQPQLRELNEQAIALKVKNLDDGDARAAYKNVALDLRQFKKLQMFIHAESVGEEILRDNDLSVFIRLGSDYRENYYEYEIPLKLTEHGWYQNESEIDRERVWPEDNFMDLVFEQLQLVKQRRNSSMREAGSTLQSTSVYSEYDGERKISVIGNPNLSNVRTIMVGIRNRSRENNPLDDDGLPKSAELWLNELRLAGFNEQGGWAAQSRISLNLADFSDIALAGDYSTPGFGSIEKRVTERQISTDFGYDFSSSFQLGKFFPNKFGVHIPLYFGYSEAFSDPQYNPVDPDIKLKTTLSDPNFSQSEKDSLLHIYRDYVKRKSINVTNARIEGNREKQKDAARGNRGGLASKPFYHISHWSVSYGYKEIFRRNVNVHHNIFEEYSGALGYNYTITPKSVKPFSKFKFLRNKAFQIIRDFNFYYQPSMLAFRTDVMKTYNEVQMRNVEQPQIELDTTFDKQFIWNREYDMRYSLTRDLKFTYHASNRSWVREPYGRIDDDDPYRQQKIDTVWNSIRNFGEPRSFHQQITGNWNVPINKLPLLGWTNATARYDADFYWDKGPVAPPDEDVELGHTIKNNQRIQLNGQLNMTKLYRSVGFLKKADDRFKQKGRGQKTRTENVEYKSEISMEAGEPKRIFHRLDAQGLTVRLYDKDRKPIRGETNEINSNVLEFTPSQSVTDGNIIVRGKREVKESILSVAADYFLYGLMSVRNISVSYSETNGTILPGFIRESRFFGFDRHWDAPGYEFLLGMQDPNYGGFAANSGWLSGDSLINSPFIMNSNKGYDIRATLEPIKDMRIDVTANRSRVDNFQEFWLRSEDDNEFYSENRMYNGNFSVSVITLGTSFDMNSDTYESAAYNQFLENRELVAGRLASGRAQANSAYDPNAPNIDYSSGEIINDGYPNGYSPVSQEVLLPSFVAAYTMQPAEDVSLNPFMKFPMPNWRLKYDGLTNMDFISKLLKKVMINHGYRSSFLVNSYQSNLNFDFDSFNRTGFSFERNEQNGMFIPRYQIDGVAVDEKYTPLIGIDLMLHNDISLKLEYSRSRTLALSFGNNQMLQGSNQEYIVGFGYKIPDLELPISFGGNQQLLKSDLNIRADFSYREMMTVVRRITEADNQLSAGQENISVKLNADYDLNNRVTLRLFYDQVIIRPAVSTAYDTSNTKVGFSIRFDLVPR